MRDETTPEDFAGIVAACAVLTARGGMTSHAAVVARGMGKCAIVGCKDMEVDTEHRSFAVNGTRISEGDWLTLDGATVGEVLNGLAGKHPETHGQLFAEDGQLNRFVNVYVNDEDVRVQQGLQTGVAAGDTVVILPAMAGGRL